MRPTARLVRRRIPLRYQRALDFASAFSAAMHIAKSAGNEILKLFKQLRRTRRAVGRID
ncbi:MAG: hypothetical protein L6244_00790 [Candidatus Methanoperedenaceae archaeon]|nr:hypothetical protein [Candidatus Methanoperedenaceae archaeon]